MILLSIAILFLAVALGSMCAFVWRNSESRFKNMKKENEFLRADRDAVVTKLRQLEAQAVRMNGQLETKELEREVLEREADRYKAEMVNLRDKMIARGIIRG